MSLFSCPSCPLELSSGRNFLLSFVPLHLWNDEIRKCGGCARTKEKDGRLVNKVVSSEILKCDISRCYPPMYIINRCAHLCIYASDTVLQFWNKYQRPVVSSKTSFEWRQKLLPSMTALEKKGFCITDRDAEFSPGWAHPKEKFTVFHHSYIVF